MDQKPAAGDSSPVQRARIFYAVLLIIFSIFALRAFYLQVIRYSYYKQAALSDQLKQYSIPAQRGLITAHLDGASVPIVLNQELYTLYADPATIKGPEQTAKKLQSVIGGSTSSIEQLLQASGLQYVVLKEQLTQAQSNKIIGFQLPGVGTEGQEYRTYPEGDLAAQVLGFVNNNGQGEYGIEQAMNTQLAGKAGQLKAVTDINGVPLAANPNNVQTAPVNGDNVDLTLNIGMQEDVQKILESAEKQYDAQDATAVVMNIHNGDVLAMANYPTYDPANYQEVSNPDLYQNDAVTDAIEPGSITKLFTVSAALQNHIITPTTTFFDPGSWTIDGATIQDVAIDHAVGEQSIYTLLLNSLDTGADWVLMQMGGGQINSKARDMLYDYFAKHFMLGKPTGIQQGVGEEDPGYVASPNGGSAINLTYAEMAFGQSYTATALQMVSGLSSIINGGTYYQPTLVDQITSPSGKVTNVPTKIEAKNVVTQQTSNDIISLMEQNNQGHINEGFTYLNFGSKYIVGGKTGTAQVAMPTGGYYPNLYNATYTGFVGGNTPQYAITVYMIEPTNYSGFGGADVGQPVWSNIAHMLVNDFGVTPKS